MSKYSFRDTLKGLAAAALGVQSDKNREKDFSQGKSSHFIIGGLVGVILFVLALVAVVSLVVPN